MELLTFTIAAGETKRFEAQGRYLEVIESTYPLSVFLSDASGGRVDSMRDVESGIYTEGQFSAVEVMSVQAQTIKLMITSGRGGSRRQPGIVSVTNKIGPTVTQTELSGGVLLPAGFTATQVVGSGANVRGLLVRRAVVNATAGAGGTSEVRLVAAPVVPATTVPVNAYNMAEAAGAAGVAVIDKHADMNYQLPPGWGVWCLTNHTIAAAAVSGYSFTYETL